jgi:hypothetical protein
MTSFVLVLFLGMGAFQVSALPPFQVPDEKMHWVTGLNRVHRTFGQAGPLCSTEISLARQFIDPQNPGGAPLRKIAPDQVRALNPECESAEIPYGSALTYPQLWISHGYHLWVDDSNPIRTLAVARLSAGLLILLAALSAARAAHRSRNSGSVAAVWVTLVLLLSPIGSQQSFAVSPDVVTMAFAILVMSLVTAGSVWTALQWMFFIFVCAAAIPAKPFMALLVLPSLWLGRQQTRRIRWAAVILFVSGIALGISAPALNTSGPGANSTLQKSLILKSPIQTTWLIAKTTAKIGGFYSHRLLARLGWLDHAPSALTFALYVLFLAMTYWLAIPRSRFNNSPRRHWAFDLLTVGIWFGSASLITLMMYLVWTPPGFDGVSGLQGRYFLPLHLVLIGYLWARFSSTSPDEVLTPKREQLKAVVLMILGLCYAVALMVDTARFYR